MDLQLTIPGKASSSIQVSDKVFAQDYKETLVHQVANAYLAKARAGTKAQKSKSEVSGGGKKPWAQKGGGRARAGSIRSPLWRKGGVTFAAEPRDFSQKVNKKMYRSALRSILSELVRLDRLIVTDDFVIDSHKTKDLIAKLKTFDLEQVLLIVDGADEKLVLASRNLHTVNVCDVNNVDPVSLIAHEKLLITVSALKKLEERLV